MKKTALGGMAMLVAVAVVACIDATSNTTGGEALFDTTPPASTAVSQSCDIGMDAGMGTTFTDLHRDFFGPSGAASCAGNGTCHGDASQMGAKSSGGYVCGA